jgi:hypothetical protein
VDTLKLTFDSKFNNINEDDLIQSEILRQIDKSINNSIGTFHEQILGGIKGFEAGNLSGFDIKASDDTVFAVFGSVDLSKNISEAIFHKFTNDAQIFKNAKFYYVLIDDFSDLNEKWVIGNEEYSISQKRVFKISLKELYNILAKQVNALFLLHETLPKTINDYMKSDNLEKTINS